MQVQGRRQGRPATVPEEESRPDDAVMGSAPVAPPPASPEGVQHSAQLRRRRPLLLQRRLSGVGPRLQALPLLLLVRQRRLLLLQVPAGLLQRRRELRLRLAGV